jgi:hypothetical protein
LRYFFRELRVREVRVRELEDEDRRRDVPFLPLLEVLLFFLALDVLFFRAPPFLPPPVSLLTVAHARRSASPVLTPRFL